MDGWIDIQGRLKRACFHGYLRGEDSSFPLANWFSLFIIIIITNVNLSLYIPGDYTYVCCHMAYRALESDRLVVGKDWTADDSVSV